ncbi:hypothetical protein [Fluviicola sp.]|jgi:hypothetical protein|uniref:hypothetical protein n=1 Tax=Fluviicola sp. TaxID=1917219 RepID=UPI002631EDF4|nr:hypothetical protein [Fluviicola sp.]
MKKTSALYLKTTLVIFGFLLVTFGFFIEFKSICGYAPIPGSESQLWYIFSLSSISIFSLSYFFNNLLGKILVYSFAVILISYMIIATWGSKVGWGKPCDSSENGYYLTILGSLLILVAAIIAPIISKKKASRNTSSELIDQNDF